MTHIKAEIKQLQKLKGGVITDIIESKPDGVCDGSFGFIVQMPTGKRHDVWVDCDPEGNGPGHLSIEDSK